MTYLLCVYTVDVKLNHGNRENHMSGVRSRSTIQQWHFFTIKYTSFWVDWNVALQAIRVYEKLPWITSMVYFSIGFCNRWLTFISNYELFHNELAFLYPSIISFEKKLIFGLKYRIQTVWTQMRQLQFTIPYNPFIWLFICQNMYLRCCYKSWLFINRKEDDLSCVSYHRSNSL